MSPASLALLRAAQTGDLQLLESALENGADIHAIQDKDPIHRGSALPADLGAAALNAAIRAAGKKELTGNHIEMIERLLACGVDVNQKLYPDPGSYPIHAAVYGGHDPLMHLLIERGATLFTTGREGASLLRWAASSGTTWLISLLLERIFWLGQHGADECRFVGTDRDRRFAALSRR